MNCTEIDARCKICPITMPSMGVKTCVGSACMAWKWNEPCRREPVEELDKRRTGYCGMTNVGDE